MVYKCAKACTINDHLGSFVGKARTGLHYVLARRGPLAVSAGTAGAFFRTDPALATPDIQVHFLLFSTDKMGTTLHPFSGFSASICQLRPESRGTVRIRSADHSVSPAIQPNYLATEGDKRTIVAGLRRLRSIMRRPAITPYVAEEHEPDPKIESDAEFLAYARARGTTIYHPTSTCRMGPDPRAVVDERLRVKGLERLRVVDGSVMPTVVSGNTNAPIVMIAEKASDMIRADAR
jgi:choline dehydrogenase